MARVRLVVAHCPELSFMDSVREETPEINDRRFPGVSSSHPENWQRHLLCAKKKVKPDWRSWDWGDSFDELGNNRRNDAAFEGLRLAEGPLGFRRVLKETRQNLSPEQFRRFYERRCFPVVVAGVSSEEDGECAAYCDMEHTINRRYGDCMFTCGEGVEGLPVKIKLKHFLTYMEHQTDKSPLCICDSDHGGLLGGYGTPAYFPDDLLSLVEERHRPPYRWLLVEPKRSCASIRVDALGRSSWHVVVKGSKLWAMFPPGTDRSVATGANLRRQGEDSDPVAYFTDILPLIRATHAKVRIFQFVQSPGDTVFVPSGWWFAALTLEDCVAVSRAFCSHSNFAKVWRQARKVRNHLSVRWMRALQTRLPDLGQEATRLDAEDGLVISPEGDDGPGLFLAAVDVALKRAIESSTHKWYTSTVALSVTSLAICRACREAPTTGVVVEGPRTLDVLRVRGCDALEKIVPAISPLRITWANSMGVDVFNAAVGHVCAAKALSFTGRFNECILKVAWPRSLVLVCFSGMFNQPLEGVNWGGTIVEVRLGGAFNQSIANVKWPKSLVRLRLGGRFNQLLTGNFWPMGLLDIATGVGFQSSLSQCVLPPALRSIIFGGSWNDPDFHNVMLPPTTKCITFGASFNQPLVGFEWPPNATTVCFSLKFDHPVRFVRWPATLEVLRFGDDFQHSLKDCAWPSSLVELEVGRGFNHAACSTKWPATLQTLVFSGEFDGKIAGASFPTGLKSLAFGDYFRQSIVDVVWPIGLERLAVGRRFCQLPKGAIFPRSLIELKFGEKVHDLTLGRA